MPHNVRNVLCNVTLFIIFTIMTFINNLPPTANYVQATVLNSAGDKKSLSSTSVKSDGAKRKVLIYL